MFLFTLCLTMLVFIGVSLVLVWARTTRYRLTAHSTKSLLRLVLAGKATEHDWRLFSALPLRHNPSLEAIRSRCLEIEDREYIGCAGSRFLFTRQGLEELSIILSELEREEG